MWIKHKHDIQQVRKFKLIEQYHYHFIGDNGTNRNIRTTMKDGTIVRGGKGLTIDTGVRVPMIVYWGKITIQSMNVQI